MDPVAIMLLLILVVAAVSLLSSNSLHVSVIERKVRCPRCGWKFRVEKGE